jgi:hypothetical protein
MHENKGMKPVEIVLRREGGRRTMERVNITKIYYKHIGIYPVTVSK